MKKGLLGVTLCFTLALGVVACSSKQVQENPNAPALGKVTKGVETENKQEKQKETLEDLAILTPVEKYLHALKMEDADGAVATYSDKTPDKEQMKQQLQRFFSAFDIRYQVVSQSIVSKTDVNKVPTKATVKVAVKSIATNSETEAEFQNNQRTDTFELIYENNQWKIENKSESNVQILDKNGNITKSKVIGD